MTITYRIFDVHEVAGDAVATGQMPFRPVVGDRIYVGHHVYTVEECRMRHDTALYKIERIDLMCVRRDP